MCTALCTGMVLVRDGCEVHLFDPCVRVSRLPRTVFLPVPWNSLNTVQSRSLFTPVQCVLL